jgi:hypothetical protein
VRNEEVLHRDKGERNILYTVKRRKDNWIGQILCRNRLLKQVIGGEVEGRAEVTGRRGRRCEQVLHELRKKEGI